MAKGDFLDPTVQHTLSEQECELIAFFRTLSKPKRQMVLQALFHVLLAEETKKAERRKKKEEA